MNLIEEVAFLDDIYDCSWCLIWCEDEDPSESWIVNLVEVLMSRIFWWQKKWTQEGVNNEERTSLRASTGESSKLVPVYLATNKYNLIFHFLYCGWYSKTHSYDCFLKSIHLPESHVNSLPKIHMESVRIFVEDWYVHRGSVIIQIWRPTG